MCRTRPRVTRKGRRIPPMERSIRLHWDLVSNHIMTWSSSVYFGESLIICPLTDFLFSRYLGTDLHISLSSMGLSTYFFVHVWLLSAPCVWELWPCFLFTILILHHKFIIVSDESSSYFDISSMKFQTLRLVEVFSVRTLWTEEFL